MAFGAECGRLLLPLWRGRSYAGGSRCLPSASSFLRAVSCCQQHMGPGTRYVDRKIQCCRVCLIIIIVVWHRSTSRWIIWCPTDALQAPYRRPTGALHDALKAPYMMPYRRPKGALRDIRSTFLTLFSTLRVFRHSQRNSAPHSHPRRRHALVCLASSCLLGPSSTRIHFLNWLIFF